MQTLMVTICAMQDDEPVVDCQAELDLVTYEVTDLTDQTFLIVEDNVYEGFSLFLDEKYYPVAVDYLDDGNEFMIMDSDAVEAIIKYVKNNPTEVDGEPDDFHDEVTIPP